MTTHHTLSEIDYIQILRLKVRFFLKHQKTTLINQHFTFTGKQSVFIDQFKGSASQITRAKSMQINLIGKEVYGKQCCNQCLYCIFQCFVLPTCCQCCKDYGQPGYIINIKAYQRISEIIKNSPKVKILYLNIIDNNLDKIKLDILSQSLQKSSITQFELVNLALDSNYQGEQFNQFIQNCTVIKKLNLNVLSLIWSNHVIQNVNNPNIYIKSENVEQSPGRIYIPTFKIQQEIINKKVQQLN